MVEDPLVVSISSSSSINPEEISRKSFPTTRRGVDGDAVRRYLETIASEVRAILEHETSLRRRLAEAERRAAEPEIDEVTLTRAVGSETARILQTAHDAARDVLERAEARSAELLSEAAGLAEARTAEADEAARETIAAAEQEATALIEATKRECRSTVREARELRASVVRDLSERRRALVVQLEQLRSGRDSLVEVVEAVGEAVDDLRGRLAGAEHGAWVATAEAGEPAGGAFDYEDAVGGLDDLDLRAEELGEPQAGLPEGEASEEGGSNRSVEELFARIRASRTEGSAEPAEETGVLGQASSHEAALNEADGDGAELARRAALLSPIRTRLSRAMKRALQDDQNELLDALRHASGASSLDELLPEADQRRRLEAAVAALLAEAWTAGCGWLAGAVVPPLSAEEAGSELASQLAAELAGLLRHRLEKAFEPLSEVGDAAAQDVASAAYRDWKGARVEGLAGDFATRAFWSGAIAASPGAAVRWVVDDDGQPCPDCDDNGLAGSQAAGQPFPTGQLHPPVHPGCRCLLVAADS